MRDQLAVLPQYLFPKQLVTQIMGRLASREGGDATQWAIRRFAQRYGVNMQEAAMSDFESYKTFNAFFTRPLKEGVRPIAESDWVCPVDGAISQFGAIEKDQIFQAKGQSYSLRALVGGDEKLAAPFENGQFACIYLSPKDYHRIHMPCDGQLTQMIYVPGALFSVNPTTARGVPGLFARNERVVCAFDTDRGPMVLVLVGATVVGSMATAWHGVVNPPRAKKVRRWKYTKQDTYLFKGQEMGRFLLGSTVVMLWPQDSLHFNPAWVPAGGVRMGEVMADRAAARTVG